MWMLEGNRCRNMHLNEDGEIPAKRFKADESMEGSAGTRVANVSDDVNRQWMEKLRQILSCPVCYETMRPSVDICRNGHSVCGECRTRLAFCPLCTALFIQATNITLSQISELLKYACPNANAGCREVYYLRDEEAHLKECPYLAHRCKAGNCSWSGSREELRCHVETRHGEDVWVKDWRFTGFGDFGTDETGKFGKFLVIENEFFWMLSSYDSNRRKLCKTFQHVGSREEASNFAYQICLISVDERSRFYYKSAMDDDGGNWSRAFESPNCAVIDFGLLRAFSTCNGNFRLKYHYSIFKLK